MYFSGEHLSPVIDVDSYVLRLFENDEHKKRVQSISRAVIGVISSASLIIHRVGRGLAKMYGLDDKHAIKQVDRLLSNKKLIPENFFKHWVPYIIANRPEVKIAMDWTDFDSDDQTTIQLSVVTSHGRATPLIWKTVQKSDLKYKQFGYEREVLEVLKKYCGSSKITILADRGFGDTEHYKYIKEDLDFDYIIRFRCNIYVTSEEGKMQLASDWVPKDHTIKTFRNAGVTLEKYQVGTVVCFHDKLMKEAWCIASSLTELSGSRIVAWYSKRWGIEPQFRDTKDLHFGMGMQETTVKNTEKRDRIFIIHAIATAYLTLLGAAGEKIGLDRTLKANTVKKRVLSLLKQGCIYFNKLTTYPREKIKPLIIEFCRLLEDQQHISETLSWI